MRVRYTGSMALLFVLICIELVCLSLLSRHLTNAIYHVLIMFFRTPTIAMPILIALLFPGTLIHELSHMIIAELMGVRTGKLTLVPESIEGSHIPLGSVAIQETDAFRRSVIGVAPLLVGIAGLVILSSMLPSLWNQTVEASRQNMLFSSLPPYLFLLSSYLIFCISNSMYSSQEDMKGVIPLLVVLGMIGLAIYFAGVRIAFTGSLLAQGTIVFSSIAKSLSLVLLINLLLSGTTFVILRISGQKRR